MIDTYNTSGGGMFRLKKIDLLSVAIYSFIMYFILSLLFIIPMSMVFTMINRLMPGMMGQEQPTLFPFFSGIFLVILPVIYSFFGTIMNVIIALAYNLISIKLGGLKFSIEKISDYDDSDKNNNDESRNMF